MSQKHENIAGGMSYRTMDGINSSEIFEYLDGTDENSRNEVLVNIKDYYIASANKTKYRLFLTRKRVEVGCLEPELYGMVEEKISESLKWLEDLEVAILKQHNVANFLEPTLYKKWHVIKLVPSAVEGLLLTSLIKIKMDKFICKNHALPETLLSARKSAEKKFIKILNLTAESDLKDGEYMRVKAYNEIIEVEQKFSILK